MDTTFKCIFLLVLQLVNGKLLEEVKAYPEIYAVQRFSAELEEEIRHTGTGQTSEV